jgi:cell division protein FtsB
MTGIDVPATPARPSPQGPRVRLPASRGGIAWLVVLLIVGSFLAVQFGRQVYANWQIGQRAEAVRAEIAAVEARNAELEQELAYLKSDAWIGAEARRLSNVGSPGDQVLIIPEGAEEPLPPTLAVQAEASKPLLEQWFELFFAPD